MWEQLAAALGLLLAVYGAAELILRICYRLLFFEKGLPEVLVYHVSENPQAEYRLRRLAAWLCLCPTGVFLVKVNTENPSLQKLCVQLRLPVVTEKEQKQPETALQQEKDAL